MNINLSSYSIYNYIQMTKITFLAHMDYANVLTEWSLCINMHSEINSMIICNVEHPFNYKMQHDMI